MAITATPGDFFSVPEFAETWTPLGDGSVRFTTITLSGYKSVDEDGEPQANTGNVRIRPTGALGAVNIWPEAEYVITAPPGSFYRTSQFEVYSEEEGDGVYAIYGAATVYDGP